MLQNIGHIPQLSVISILDILVVAFIIYEFLKLIKGTRAIPMLVAVILLVAAFWLAHIEQLKTVDWLITTLFPYAVFALIVVFGLHAIARAENLLKIAAQLSDRGESSSKVAVIAGEDG